MLKWGEEIKRKIRELQESGIGDAEISRRLGIPRSTVRYQRPEYREYMRKYKREYMKKYCQRRILKEDSDFKELLNFIEGDGNYLSDRNIYVSILQFLKDAEYRKYKIIARYMGKKYSNNNIYGKIARLKKLGLIIYEDKEYKLSKKGEKLIKELYKF